MYCYKCGIRYRENSNFCSNCGSDILEKEIPTQNILKSEIDLTGNVSEIQVVPNASLAIHHHLKSNGNDSKSDDKRSTQYHPWRRFFARNLDVMTIGLLALVLFSALLGIVFYNHIDQILLIYDNGLIIGLLMYALWLPLEAIFISGTGTTPGKWLFGVSVKCKSGNRLSMGNSFKRTFNVWMKGEAFAIPIVVFFTRIAAYSRLKNTGTTLWDETVGSVVVHKEWGVFRVISIVITFFLLLLIYSFLMAMDL